jgi:hypothetical protein
MGASGYITAALHVMAADPDGAESANDNQQSAIGN